MLFYQLVDGGGGIKSDETKHKMSLYAQNRTKEHNLKISQNLNIETFVSSGTISLELDNNETIINELKDKFVLVEKKNNR